MGARSSVNQSNTAAVMLIELRQHLTRCADCKCAMQARDYDALCKWVKTRILDIAIRWDANIGIRLKARRSDDDYIFACPDVTKHGDAYRVIAEPMQVTAVAERLF